MKDQWINPMRLIRFLHATRYLHFFAVGLSGVAINLAITGILTELFFGRENYFTAYLIGLAANLLYNFVLHTIVTFKTKGNHTKRLSIFMVYSLTLAYIQAMVTKSLTSWVGVDWYLVVIASVIMAFSIMTFILFKFVLFRSDPAIDKDLTNL
jgi:putative flippase GtrA